MQSKSTGAEAGFTMIELLTVVSIVAIMAAVGIPSMLDMVRSAQVRSATSQLYDAIILARSEAVKRNIQVDVQPGTACVDPASNNTADWKTGWLVQVSSCGELLQQFPATTNTNIIPDASGGISYLPTGRLTTTSARSFDIQSTASATIPYRCIVMSASGQPSIHTGTTTNGCN
jgi:type IV fimbrial biogenesis protein FimT